MNEKFYGKYVLMLSIIAFVLTLSPFAMFLFESGKFFWYFLRFVWILGLLFAVISFFLNEHILNKTTKRFIERVSSLAIGSSFCWSLYFLLIEKMVMR